MPTLSDGWAVNDGREERAPGWTRRVNTKLRQTRLRTREILSLRIEAAAWLTGQLCQLVDIEGEVVTVGINDIESTNSHHFALAELTRRCRNLRREPADFALLTDFTQQFKPNPLDLRNARKLVRARHLGNQVLEEAFSAGIFGADQ
jgi:hypothetical protein